ncbi:putative leucine-rich repeat domain, L domain-containing protein [Medicago truncatula]|nr:putative leucine-rich repeat domain, L domain-containing protein [Medicago truncatula]
MQETQGRVICVDDILTSACGVCLQWWARILSCGALFAYAIYVSNSPYNDADMEKICRKAVELSCGHLEVIDIERFCTNDLLKCIADNGSHLLCMRLVNCWGMTNKGFSEALRKLPLLEKVDISHSYLTEVSLEALGRSCPLLKSLKFSVGWFASRESDKMAFVIAETMPGLCHLDMKGHKLSELRVLAIIDKCPLLESLDISVCLSLYEDEDLHKSCIDKINDLQLTYCYTYKPMRQLI